MHVSESPPAQERAEAIPVGDALDEACRLGPLVNKSQYEKVLGYIRVRKDAEEAGAA